MVTAAAAVTALRAGRVDAGIVDFTELVNWTSFSPVHIGWTLLAGAGLAAVAITARNVRRSQNTALPEEPLGTYVAETEALIDAPANEAIADERAAAAVEPQATEVSMQSAHVEPAVIVDDGADATEVSTAELRSDRASPDDRSTLFLELAHVDLSIDVLRRHLEHEARPMPAVWLMLLDLCRTHGRERTFHELASEFHRRFNARAPEWDGFPPGRGDAGLEAYPRIIEAITQAWGTPTCRELLDQLLYDRRGGDRRGFTINAYQDLVALSRATDAVLDGIDRQRVLDRTTDSSVDEWGSASLSGRIHEMFAREHQATALPSTTEAFDKIEQLRRRAEGLLSSKRAKAKDRRP